MEVTGIKVVSDESSLGCNEGDAGLSVFLVSDSLIISILHVIEKTMTVLC